MLNYQDFQTNPTLLKQFPARSLVDVICSCCGKPHKKVRFKIEASLRDGRKGLYCSKSCISTARLLAEVVEVDGEKKRLCKVCGERKPLPKFGNAGRSRTCNACWSKRPLQKYNEHRRKAAARGWGFHLTYEEFATFWQKPCSYCGDAIDTIGLDRRDNEQDYLLSNVVPCCSWCNYAKHTVTEEEFIRRCRMVALRQPQAR